MKKLIVSVIVFMGVLYIGATNNDTPNSTDENITSSLIEQPSISTSTGCITLSAPEDKTIKFYIYSITGQIIKTVTVSSGKTIIELPKGYYIVKCEQWSKQAIVR
ncbi:MAG: T9SS type A sorting domain-containing protein [Muribaculaceae bacterium]|nr:T9SS type A sorting domain-containing protein [Muribaculaceae bacterium]